MQPNTGRTYFAVAAPGLEPYTLEELRLLGMKVGQSQAEKRGEKLEGGVEFTGSLEDLYRANLHLRTASRILVRLGAFYAAGFPELRRKTARLPWEQYLRPGRPVALRVTCHKSRLYHSGAVAERVAAAIGDSMGEPPVIARFDEDAGEDLPQLVVVRIASDLCTISVDSSGSLLNRRGYRLATAKAPLRESLAAGILMAAGWDRSSPLIDPFCGSGTIPIEAALMMRRIPPGGGRPFAFMEWPGFQQRQWDELMAEGLQNVLPSSEKLIQASDRDAGAIQAAQANAERAGVIEDIHFACQSVSAMEPNGEKGWVVANPPYGLRTSPNKDLRNLYAQFGNVLNARFKGWHVAVLSSDVRLLRQMHVRFEHLISLVNGGVQVKLAVGKVT
ncbi:MAG: class I SAM-dependent RNA methyltransferase [Chloroflexi bacterium]|nr:class I SAM-dependent RNA methyltransferase [Chloroflexota bacterium]